MALCVRIAQRSHGLVQCRSFASIKRSSISFAINHSFQLRCPANFNEKSKRCLNTATELKSAGQEAPSAQAYIKSKAIRGNNDLVTVNKVIVIGSGGLSIGQAGEFDYSGAY